MDKNKEVESVSIERLRQEELLLKIAELGGKGLKEEDVVFEGSKLVLPEKFKGNLAGALEFLEKRRDEDEESGSFSRTYNYRPWDGARNAVLAMKKAFGMVSGQATYSFFGKKPPAYIQVPTGVSATEEVPWGKFIVPLLENTEFYFGSTVSEDYGQVFNLSVSSPRKNRFVIEGLFRLIEEELRLNSIYRGQAIDGQAQPQFIDLRGFSAEKVVYSEQVKADLEAHLWGVIRYADACRELGLPLKRSILLTGPYGTGKSLAGMRTALEATQSGWTFIMARPGRDNFLEVMQTARLYQPAVVFMEDADTLASTDNEDLISEILDMFDGIQAKSTDLIAVLTTNHPETLHKGMMRPGRLDAVIEIGALDSSGIEKLIKSVIGESRLDPNIDFKPIVAAAEGYMPAFVKELADRAVRYALVRNQGVLGDHLITTDDLVYAAIGLRPQFERMQEAPEFSETESVGESLARLMEKATKKSVAMLSAGPDDASSDVWNVEELEKIASTAAGRR